jgi:DNA-3-methyladenine glycosylase II
MEKIWVIDAVLAKAFEAVGEPPQWSRPANFATLVRIILEQGVSVGSARIIWQRLQKASPLMDPSWLAETDHLRQIGVTDRKSECIRKLSLAQRAGKLRLEELPELSDEEVIARLREWNGIGLWTAQVYLLLALQRPDVFPASDLSVQEAYRQLSGIARRPRTQKMEEVAHAWVGQRSLATRLLWAYYFQQHDLDTNWIP